MELPTIDLHHGPYSADPPYTEVEVFGTPLTEEITQALAEYGFEEFEATADGFRASRQAPAREW